MSDLKEYRGFSIDYEEGTLYGVKSWVQVLDGEKWTSVYSTREAAEADVKKAIDFLCGFWENHINRTDIDDTRAVIDGVHYIIGPNLGTHRGLGAGHGGRTFIILFNDGRRVVTRNLWCQGRVPTPYREQLPDNAKFEVN